jgi:hypothetical protein
MFCYLFDIEVIVTISWIIFARNMIETCGLKHSAVRADPRIIKSSLSYSPNSTVLRSYWSKEKDELYTLKQYQYQYPNMLLVLSDLNSHSQFVKMPFNFLPVFSQWICSNTSYIWFFVYLWLWIIDQAVSFQLIYIWKLHACIQMIRHLHAHFC